MSNPWILYAVCAVMLIIALAALLPTIFRAKEAETEDGGSIRSTTTRCSPTSGAAFWKSRSLP